ncbi:50S ribosomal protein L4 [Candidatus Uhrbacteria bacterium]|nr:50S ribosomal protein L4 [Candidatus Uhrbacteria bacterium]
MDIKLYNMAGKEVGVIALNDAMFGVEANTGLVHEAVVAQQANARQVLAHTKGRGEVRGGGRKPWRQKGTGRARHGSIRSPIWKGGGVTFGPLKWRNFALKINRKARRKALFMTLSDKVANNTFFVIDDLNMDAPKSQVVARMIHALPNVGSRTLIVVDPSNMGLRQAAANVERTETIAPHSLNVVDVLKANTVIIGAKELENAQKHFLK